LEWTQKSFKYSSFYRLASGLEKLMLSSSQEINVDKEDLEILQFIQVEGSNPCCECDLSFFSLFLDSLTQFFCGVKGGR
jgi:hypothetical protein